MENDLVPFRRLVLLTFALGLVAFGLVPAVAEAAPLVASPTSVAFNKETVGKTSPSQTVTVSNPDPGAARIAGASVVGLDAGDFSITGDSCGGAILDQGESCTVEIAFAPQAGGPREATLEFAVDGESAIDVPLSGTGQTMKLTVPGSASFPATSVGGASTEKVSLKNESEAGITVTEVKFEGPDAGDFGIEGNNCNGYIGPNMGCELNVRFSPGGSGPREALLRVTTDGSPAEYTTELGGEGAAPELSFEPGSYEFGLVEAHAGGARTSFTVRNDGAASVQLGNLEISGPDAYEFWIPGSSCWGTMLAPGATCAVEVQFNANQEGDFAAALRVSAGNVTFEAPMTARAEVPKVTASPAPLAFGATSVGSTQTREVTLTNTGHLPVAFFIALVSGGDVSSFHLVAENCTSNVFAGTPRIFEPGESCTATIAFEPKDAGAKAATVSFFGGGEGALQVAVEGTAVAARLGLTPSSRDFGTTTVGSTGPTQAFELRNESADAQTIDSARLAGPDAGEFQLLSDGCSETALDPGATCAVAVRFQPQAGGPKSATLRLRGTAGTMVAQLSGEGAASGVSAASSASSRRGRAVVSLKTHGRPAAGKVTIGRVRCESSETCVIKVSGLASGRIATKAGERPGMRPLAVAQVRLAPSTSASITSALPPEFRHLTTAARLQISLRWRTGSESGAVTRTFLLGG